MAQARSKRKEKEKLTATLIAAEHATAKDLALGVDRGAHLLGIRTRAHRVHVHLVLVCHALEETFVARSLFAAGHGGGAISGDAWERDSGRRDSSPWLNVVHAPLNLDALHLGLWAGAHAPPVLLAQRLRAEAELLDVFEGVPVEVLAFRACVV